MYYNYLWINDTEYQISYNKYDTNSILPNNGILFNRS